MGGALEMVVGVGILIVTGMLVWGARPTATGTIFKFSRARYVEDYFVVSLMYLAFTGLAFIAWPFV